MSDLEEFIIKNKNKKVVAVQGLGFVGSVMSMVCANAINEDYAVVGVELPTEKGEKIINKLNNGIFPLSCEDPKIIDYFKNSIKKGNFYATTDEKSYAYADVIIIDINLDVEKINDDMGKLVDYSVDMDSIQNASRIIGENCKENALILLESTVPPGSSEKILKPIFFNCLEERGLSTKKIKIGHSYERVMPGPKYIDSIQNFYRVYSGIDKKSADATESFLHTIISTDKYPLTRLKNTNSTEMAKVLENSYRAMNIAFIVEWSRFAEESNVNLYEVVDAIRLRPTHSNLMYPGIGVGGYCLTKDSLLASWSKQNLLSTSGPLEQSEKAVFINDQMPKFAFDFLKKSFNNLKGNKILLLGVSYRGDVGDTRSSPVELLYNLLIGDGCEVICYDPFVSFWEEKKQKIDQNIDKELNNSIDIIIITTGHSAFKKNKLINAIFDLDSLFIYDTIGFLSEIQIEKLRIKHTVKILGRGDI